MDIINLFEDNDNYLSDQLYYPYRAHNLKNRLDYIRELSDAEFFNRFRLKKETVISVLTLIGRDLRHRTNRNHSLTPLGQLLLTLRYYASGSFYIVVGDFMGVRKSTVAKAIQKVSHLIANLSPRYIKLPHTNREKNDTYMHFYDIARFPRLIAAPGGDNAENFCSRKGYFAINVQAMVTQTTNIAARWPGSTHDSTIFNNSNVRFQFERGDFGTSIILGDAGYPVRPYLLTPLGNPQTPAEALYNEAQIRTRNLIDEHLEFGNDDFQ